MKTRMAVGLVMLMLLVGISAPADADVLCANPSGSVFVRTQCKGNETQLNPVVLGLGGPQGIDGNGTGGFIPRWEGPQALGNSVIIQDDSGNIGIGTTNPAVDLDILGVSPHSRATGNTVIRTSNSNRIWQFGIRGDTNDVFSITDETVAQFRMVIDTAGNVGIGTALPGFKLDVAGDIHATGVISSSDERLKTGVRQLTHVLAKLEKIRGVSFEWNEGHQATGRSTGRRSIGVIAQEIEAGFPELVTTWGNEGHRAVDYGRLGAVLIEAVKELKAAKDAQGQQIAELEGRLAALEQGIKLGVAPVQLSSSGLLAVWFLGAAALGLFVYGWRHRKHPELSGSRCAAVSAEKGL